MKNYILKTYKSLLFNKFVGNDGKFHTVYYIEFENGSFYIGKHSTLSLENDNYFASGKLANQLKNNDVKYERQILSFCQTAKDAITLETTLLSDKKIFENDLCLNCYPGSPPDASGSIIISKGRKFKMVNPKLFNYYIDHGWKKGELPKVIINKNRNF